MDSPWSTRMCIVKLSDFVWGSYVWLWDQRVFLVSIPLPFYQELELASCKSAVQDSFHYVVFFSIHHLQWQWWMSLLSQNGVFWSLEKLDHIEDWMKLRHGGCIMCCKLLHITKPAHNARTVRTTRAMTTTTPFIINPHSITSWPMTISLSNDHNSPWRRSRLPFTTTWLMTTPFFINPLSITSWPTTISLHHPTTYPSPFPVSSHDAFPYQCDKRQVSPRNTFAQQSHDDMSHLSTPTGQCGHDSPL